MAYGLTVNNDSGQVIIDSDISHFHFAGKYNSASSVAGGTLQNHTGATDNDGGNFPYANLTS